MLSLSCAPRSPGPPEPRLGRELPERFLTAEWRYLAILNFEIEPVALAPLVPRGTELDSWQNKTLVSMVGFLFLDTRVQGLALPFHRNFEEVNLRFYVRRKIEDEWRRGVVFVWGYSRQRDGGTLEYLVEHPRWRVWQAQQARLDCAATPLYGDSFAESLSLAPRSAYLADGSSVTVHQGVRLAH